jgi:hypothetical protein
MIGGTECLGEGEPGLTRPRRARVRPAARTACIGAPNCSVLPLGGISPRRSETKMWLMLILNQRVPRSSPGTPTKQSAETPMSKPARGKGAFAAISRDSFSRLSVSAISYRLLGAFGAPCLRRAKSRSRQRRPARARALALSFRPC